MEKEKTYLLTALAAVTLLSAFGCSKKATLPPTYPVHGKVVLAGGRPLGGGSILFQSQNEPAVSATGVIEADGTFTLSTFKAGARAPGAIAGRHSVTVTWPMDSRKNASVPSIVLPDPCTVLPKDNELTLTLPKRVR